jgi:hypothetical protein
VQWHRREYNKVADYIVNITMDCGHDVDKQFVPPIKDFDVSEGNFICHSDGGTRGESCSAIGWIIEVVVVRGNREYNFPYALAGRFLKEPVSSFLAEAMALDEAITFISKIVNL